ncbi:glycerol dehydratase reactivase beta/small subunit family protein [Arthrobacter sp. SLBN-53]|uniref:glycerol dehydratase reactivase beta/small subunit family protein n=1 Tax=Arthrobacter sp. SLBN-53 TaxID=2768412 RepID=UPI0011542090|nr:glycerol dehydratase reactivase beta/small subunit family protein [Arthrobacter sp. SLBN-53]TQK30810.1 dehydratase medium subunit [Arthrobacter sp. SLBN-53]
MLEGGQPEKPAILVLSAGGALESEVLAGIEEEGVPYVVERVARDGDSDAQRLARRAAARSSLDVGVGIDADGRVAILHDKLPDGVEGLSGERPASPRAGRVAGHNAARIVVGVPLMDEPI